MTPHSLIETIAGLIQARVNCAKAGNTEWLGKHSDSLHAIERNDLPSGSGIDSGTTIDLDTSTVNRIVFNTAFRHMSEHGYYDGWTEHRVIAQPSFIGRLTVTVTGRNRNDIKDYLGETFNYCLSQVAPMEYQPIAPAPAEGD